MARSGSASIIEPEGVDLFLAGGDLSVADMKLFRALLHKSREEIQRSQEKMADQPWMDEPIPTLQQLVALQHKREDAMARKRPALPPGILEIDESGIGGNMTPEENAYLSAYIWSSKRTSKKYHDIGQVLTVAQEPAPSWGTVKRKNKRTKA
jgi:hypothetical protein